MDNPSWKSKKRYNGRLWEINWWYLTYSFAAVGLKSKLGGSAQPEEPTPAELKQTVGARAQ